ncbi:L-2-hydroxyglutarate oxidase [Phytoactinopolyspora alkaliphila]|uniref:L-2-hydroxyglutarate oxidase n=1 Tax=Phytoactinopolyspora alkaliphila TaxID=1783498 RepID=A0A6N9YND6_9ACTN|nr:L-2-hydroxyglutarate oxidase [Phytoactinopolyspora alkaliphila]NED96494.1 L-2-hydroxyglutarate oxidase [Phytoactinopolyspora alkaliphila]
MDDERADVVVVGAGIIGLALSLTLLRQRPGLKVVVVEKEAAVAAHQSSHNSGVLHAGIYYPPGSLKAKLCRRGARMLHEYAIDRGIPVLTNGKLVIASSAAELGRLKSLAERARLNAVPELRMIDAAEIPEHEPAAVGVAALLSPSTGVVDFAAVARAMATDIAASGGLVHTRWPVSSVTQAGATGVVVQGDRGVIRATTAVCCAGVQADRLTGPVVRHEVRVVPFRGTWYRLTGPQADAIRGNIYPVPDPRFPFLGVHVTRRIDGQVWAGPNALLTLAREGRRRFSANARDTRDALTFPGLWRFAMRNIGAARVELGHELSRTRYAREVGRYLPGVQAKHLERGPAGIRAQAMLRDGRLIDDFLIRDDGPVTHVLSAPSPAATASMAIGESLAARVLQRHGDS